MAFWQGMRVELKQEGVPVNSGDDVYLKSDHTGKFVEVEGESVRARWNDQGLWQRLKVASVNGGPINSGDVIFFTAHTSKMLEVESTESNAVRARYTDHGNWQQFVIRSAAGGAIRTGEAIFLTAHTGNLVDVEGAMVRARFTEQGLWQSLRLEKHSGRALQQTSQAVTKWNDADDLWFGAALGVVSGLLAVALLTAVMVALVGKLSRWQLFTKLSETVCPASDGRVADGKVHPSNDGDTESD